MGTAGLFVLLHAEFLAAVQVLLYAGGVVTIVVFAIMLTERLVGDSIRQTNRGILAGRGGGAAPCSSGWRAPSCGRRGPRSRRCPSSRRRRLGRQRCLTEWVLAFEVLGILLVAALLGALYLARTEE